MCAVQYRRRLFLVSVVFVAGVMAYATATAGLVQASAFLPVLLGMWLLERRRGA